MNIDITLTEALERASEGLRKKMLHSVELLQKAEKIALNYDAEQGYYLAFSGGKDSQALFHMTQLAGVKFRGHMNLTSVDPPEVIRFVKKNYPEVELIKPGKSIFQIAVEKQILPTMRVRWCCKEYKETAGAGKVTLIGIRKAKSARRAKRNEVEINNRKFSGNLDGLDEYRQELKAKRARRKSKEQGVNITNADEEQTLGCIHGKESLLISPIIYWTEQDVWEFLNDVVKVPHCSLYDEGWSRIGCIGCPMSSHKQKMIENERYPHVKRNWIKAIKAIRNGRYSKESISGGISARTGSSQKRQRIAQDAGGYIKHPDPGHWTQHESTNSRTGGGKKSQEYEEQQCRHSASANNGCEPTTTGRRNSGVWAIAASGFHPAPLLTA
ncbi:phosphoadenosine phosphosulfate reductase family protein [uncultured Prevotella sp.]|uniref:phosphoadenosine phosphosulfate reductase family protein n=1 Tax=uncultured Prevotella sp. TaxID=159272 RepID=UPI00266B4ACC|nr:phosphoadenosine phosphosulfate reductase family protein [uncultured Prevotella sp.]